MIDKKYGVCISFTNQDRSMNVSIIDMMINNDFKVINLDAVSNVIYFEYNKAYDIDNMSKVIKPIITDYLQYIDNVHYFTLNRENMKDYL